MDFADYLREKYKLAADEGQTRPSTADISAFAGTDDQLYAAAEQEEEERRPATVPQRPRTASAAAMRYTADRLSRNRAAKRAMIDVTTHTHLSNLYHLNRRIQEMYAKSGRKGYSPPASVGRIEEDELAAHGDWGGGENAAAPLPRVGSPGRLGIGSTPRILGAPPSPPSHNLLLHGYRPMSAPSPGHMTSLAALASRAAGQEGAPAQRPGTGASRGWGRGGQQQQAAALQAALGSSRTAGAGASGLNNFTERRVKNTAQALKNAILAEIVENRIYEEQRLKQLFRSYLKLNSGEAFYPTLIRVVEELKAELDVK